MGVALFLYFHFISISYFQILSKNNKWDKHVNGKKKKKALLKVYHSTKKSVLKAFLVFIDDDLNHLKLGFVVSCGKWSSVKDKAS